MSEFLNFHDVPVVALDELVQSGDIELGRGNIISKIDIRAVSGLYPIYSSSSKNNGMMGRYGKFMFDEEMVTWSVDGGGSFFYRPRHKFSVTNVSGYMRANQEKFDYKFLHGVLDYQHSFLNFDYQSKAHPSVIRELYEIPIPPLPEQKKIASILTSVDEVIENTQKQIDKLQDLKKATMNELLTKGIGHTEFKDSELGRIPKSWEVVSLGKLADVIDPQPDHRTPPSVDCGVPYVGMADVGSEGNIDFESARSVSATVLEEQIDRFDIYSGAFLIGKIGTIGNASVLPEKRFYCLSANIILVSSKDISVQRFIYQVFKSAIIEKQIQDQTNTTSQPALGIKKVRDFLIPMPAEDEQASIVSILSAIDEGIAINKHKLSQTQFLKKSLMQDLLTGKVRVTVN